MKGPTQREIYGHRVVGVDVDEQTRCRHYHGPADVVAIRMACCGVYFACIHCHAELAGHQARRWPAPKADAAAVLCGACGAELTIAAYLAAQSRCPACLHPFNPGCAKHWPLYFDLPGPPLASNDG